jgi:hypothetical protein
MGKSGKARKKRRLEQQLGAAGVDGAARSSSDEGEDDGALEAQDINNAIKCLKYMSANLAEYRAQANKPLRKMLFPLIEEQRLKYFDPVMQHSDDRVLRSDWSLDLALRSFAALSSNISIFSSPELKPLRRAMHPLVHESNSGCLSLSGEVAAAMNSKAWSLSLRKMLEMKRLGEVPKLGAVQRWVRQCDELDNRDAAVIMLSVVIRLTTAGPWSDEDSVAHLRSFEEALAGSQESPVTRIERLDPFVAPVRPLSGACCVVCAAGKVSKDQFIVVSIVPGRERRPPSEIGMNIYAPTTGSILLCRDDDEDTSASDPLFRCCLSKAGEHVRRHAVPGVPGAFLLSNVLCKSECRRLIEAAEMLGFYRDAVEGIEAQVWVDSRGAVLGPLFERCRELLPQTAVGGAELASINPRLRFFRYRPGAVYRPHIDGSWAVGTSDASYGAEQAAGMHSYMTFLIYLNDGFSGGGTTFFVPKSDFGLINAQSVEPVQGSILCFPHGIVDGSLVHEGSAVLEGVKYVIRSDVMYFTK